MTVRSILISGNLGSGKTSLANRLADELDMPVVTEPVEDNAYQSWYYADPAEWALRMQLEFLLRRIEAYESAASISSEVILDRSPFEDRGVFLPMMLSQGYITRLDARLYREVYSRLMTGMAEPTLIIFLTAPIATLLSRVRERGRLDSGVDAPYLERVERYYESWPLEQRCPIVREDTSGGAESLSDYRFTRLAGAVKCALVSQ